MHLQEWTLPGDAVRAAWQSIVPWEGALTCWPRTCPNGMGWKLARHFFGRAARWVSPNAAWNLSRLEAGK